MRRIAVAVVLVVGIVGMVLLTGCGGGSNLVSMNFTKGNKGGPRTFVSVVKQDGICQASDGIGVLGGQKGKKITWYVSNYCDVPVYVAFTHYADPADPTKYLSDIVDPDLKISGELKVGKEDEKVEATIMATTKNKIYKYSVCVSASPILTPVTNPPQAGITCLDPDVDIWP
jgi:hypothetical protein